MEIMQRILWITIISLFECVPLVAQTIDGKEIRNRDIEWPDFTGAVDSSSPHDAYTYWITTYSFPSLVFRGETARVKVTVRLFLTSNSWVRPNKQTARLLNHERGHFRIGRICANEIELTINSMDFSLKAYHKEIDAVYWKIIEKYRAVDSRYDVDTDHYINQELQAAWDKKLEALLNGQRASAPTYNAGRAIARL